MDSRTNAMLKPPETKVTESPRIRVMVVDDSAIIRGLITRMLEANPAITVAASCANGQAAIHELARTEVDLVVLDIEMPVMDGLTALPELLKLKPGLPVVIASTLSQRNAEISLKALSLGAADYVPKPSGTGLGGSEDFRRELVEKVLALGNRPRRHAPAATAAVEAPVMATAHASRPFALRQPGAAKPHILAIGSSTGGPPALNTFLALLRPSLRAPIVITQHMPPTFTTILAQQIAKTSGRPCHEAVDGETILPGSIYVAPGSYHMIFERRGATCVARLNQEPPENFCRPAVDPMLRSLVRVFGANVLTVILTGMGADGKKGSQEVVAAGGTVVAQDEASSVVWGMPGAVATAGLCAAVLPLPKLATYVMDAFGVK